MRNDPFEDNPIVLSEPEQAAIQAWVDRVKPMLALSDWDITVTRHGPEKSAFASSYLRDESDESVLALDPSFRDARPDQMRQRLTHELLHCHFQPVKLMAEKLIAGELGHRTEVVIEEAIKLVEERTIDRLATAVARFLPLVDLPAQVPA